MVQDMHVGVDEARDHYSIVEVNDSGIWRCLGVWTDIGDLAIFDDHAISELGVVEQRRRGHENAAHSEDGGHD